MKPYGRDIKIKGKNWKNASLSGKNLAWWEYGSLEGMDQILCRTTIKKQIKNERSNDDIFN